MITVSHNGGFFSCCNIRFQEIVEFYKNHKILPKVDSSAQFAWYKTESLADITYNYFQDESQIHIDFHETDVTFHHEQQFSDYKTLPLQKFSPIIKKYFSPSNNILSKIDFLKEKYSLDFDNICVLFFRGNDKQQETKLSSYDDYIPIAQKILIENPSIRFLIQSDETGFIEKMSSVFKNNIIFKDEIRHITKCNNTVDRLIRNKIDIFSQFYLAITIIMAKCKYVVCGSGNCSLFIVLYRGNCENLYQNLNNAWIQN
jgi:hypothetical protein